MTTGLCKSKIPFSNYYAWGRQYPFLKLCMVRQNFEVDGGSSCSFMSMEEMQTSTLNMFLCAEDLFEDTEAAR